MTETELGTTSAMMREETKLGSVYWGMSKTGEKIPLDSVMNSKVYIAPGSRSVIVIMRGMSNDTKVHLESHEPFMEALNQ